MNNLIRNLAEACRQQLLEEKWLIAPSLRAGHQWLDQVTKTGQPVVNVHTKSIKGMVFDLASPYMISQGLRPLSDTAAVLIMDQILTDIRQQLDLGHQQLDKYFSLLPESISLSKGIYSSIKDIRLAGLDERSLNPSAFEKTEKGREITIILNAYQERLEKLGLVDYPRAVDLVLEALSRGLETFDCRILVLKPINIDLTAKERAVFSRLPQGMIVDLPSDDTATSDRTESQTGSNPSFTTCNVGDISGKSTIRTFSAVGEINEVREIFRRCVVHEIPFDQIEVLCTDTDTYVPLIFEQALKYRPDLTAPSKAFVTFHEGIPAMYSRPGRAIAAWVSWIRENFSQSVLVKMLEETLILPRASGVSQERGLGVARILRSANIGFGRERYLPALEILVRALENKLSKHVQQPGDEDVQPQLNQDGIVSKLERSRSLLLFVTNLLDMTPGPESGHGEILTSAKRFLESSVAIFGETDFQSQRVLLDEIRDMEWLIQQTGETNLKIWDWLTDLPKDLRVLGSGPRPGAMHVSNLNNGGHTGRPFTFIVGLDDGRFPGTGLQDPVLLDSERAALSPDLLTANRQLSRKIEKFNDLIGSLTGDVTLSYSSRSISDDSEMVLSQVLTPFNSGTSAAETHDKISACPVSFVPSKPDCCGDMTEWWLSRLCRAIAIDDADNLLEYHFPHLRRGKRAAQQRNSDKFTIYDGFIPNPEPILDPMSHLGPVVSSSRLQTVGTCPRQYFFKYVLKIEAPQDLEVNKDLWLDSAEFGTLLHEIFYDFVSQRQQNGWPPDFAVDLEIMEELVAKNIEEKKRLAPPPSDDVFQHQRDKLFNAAKVFLRHESQTRDTYPFMLEAAFGLPIDEAEKRGTPVSRYPVKLKLPNGKFIRAWGIMDRVDRTQGSGSSEYVIRDYKSGSTYRYRSKDPFWGGRSVQHGLYTSMLLAASDKAIPAPRLVKEFIYFFPGDTEQGLSIVYDAQAMQDCGLVLQNLCQTIANGCFIATNEPKTDCKYCVYMPICENADYLEATIPQKLANPDNKSLEPFRELRSREQQKSK